MLFTTALNAKFITDDLEYTFHKSSEGFSSLLLQKLQDLWVRGRSEHHFNHLKQIVFKKHLPLPPRQVRVSKHIICTTVNQMEIRWRLVTFACRYGFLLFHGGHQSSSLCPPGHIHIQAQEYVAQTTFECDLSDQISDESLDLLYNICHICPFIH